MKVCEVQAVDFLEGSAMADNLHVHSLLGGEEIQHSGLTVALTV